MELGFSIVLLILVLLFYRANPRNKVNKWCAIAGLLFWVGVAKEALLFNIVPLTSNPEALRAVLLPVYSVCTWILYSFAMPTAVIFSLYFSNLGETKPKLLRVLKPVLYIPAVVLSFFFPPLEFRALQLTSQAFWIAYAVYNLGLCVVFTYTMLKGMKSETAKEKRQVRLVVVPPVVFWAASVFLTHPFHLDGLLKLWQLNAAVLLFGLTIFLIMAFRDGFMGLRLSKETYNWNSNMNLINTGAEYTGHMLKNQAAKMELCIEQLRFQFEQNGLEQPPEELDILSRSIAALRDYVDKIKRHSQNIRFLEESCVLIDLLRDALPAALAESGAVTVRLSIADNVILLCDRGHMREVFANLLLNAAEALRGDGTIEVTDEVTKSDYRLHFTDNGIGMDAETMEKMCVPYFTTKSTEKNFGLGLSYCKNVIVKHGGRITVKSKPGKGAVVTLNLPRRRVTQGALGAGAADD